MQKSISKRLISSTLLMLSLVLILTGVSIWSIQQVGRSSQILLDTTSYIDILQELRHSFDTILMPPHDYLINGDPNELYEFEKRLSNLKKIHIRIPEILKSSGIKMEDKDLFPLQEGIDKIEILARDILVSPDPYRVKRGRVIKELYAQTESFKIGLKDFIKAVSKNRNFKEMDSLYMHVISFSDILVSGSDYMMVGNQNELDNFNRLLSDLQKEIEEIFRHFESGPERDRIIVLRSGVHAIRTLADQLIEGKDPAMGTFVEKMKRMDKTADYVSMKLDTLLKDFKRVEKIEKTKADRIRIFSINFITIMSIIVVIGAIAGGLVFSSHITNPVRQLLRATQRISEGDLTHKAEVKTEDEIGALATSFNRMTDDLKNYQEQLIRAKEYIDNIIKSMIDTLIVVNPDGTVQTVNQATLRLLKYNREEDLIGKPIEKIFAEDARLFKGEKAQLLIGGGSVTNYDTGYMTREGSEIPINLSASAIIDKEGKLLGTVCVARDMREIKKLIHDLKKAYKDLQDTQAQLIQSSRLASMGVLAAGVAHEINNPMNIIINYAGLLEDELKKNSENYQYVQGILKEGDRIINIVKNLLTFARADKQYYSPCHITDIIDSALSFMDIYFTKDNIKTQRVYAPNLPVIRSKSSQLEQVFINLILNARDALNDKYPRPDSNKLIRIEAIPILRDGISYIKVSFTDYGNGIEEENMDKVFDPFFTTKRTGKGTGLGLSISYGIITDHKGSIEVKSERYKYTTFIIYLPTEEGWFALEG